MNNTRNFFNNTCTHMLFRMAIVLISLGIHATEKSTLGEPGDPLDEEKTRGVTRQLKAEEQDISSLCSLTPQTGWKIFGGMLGTVPSSPECGLSFVYGAFQYMPYSGPAHTSLITSILAQRTPIHITRLINIFDNFTESLTDLKKQYPGDWQAMFLAKCAHAVFNHALPITYIAIQAEKEFPLFAAVTIPPLFLSYFSRGMENRSLKKIVSPMAIGIVPMAMMAPMAVMMGFVTQHLLEGSLPPEINYYMSWGISLAIGAASFTLRSIFDPEEVVDFIQKTRQNPALMMYSMCQASLVTSAYYGLSTSLGIAPELPTLAIIGSYVGFETMKEANSVAYNTSKIFTSGYQSLRSRLSW